MEDLDTDSESYARFMELAETLEDREIGAGITWDGHQCGADCPGWGVFSIGRAPGVEIERCDECERFATDEEAEDYVLRLTIKPTCGDADCMHCRRRIADVALPEEPTCAGFQACTLTEPACVGRLVGRFSQRPGAACGVAP